MSDSLPEESILHLHVHRVPKLFERLEFFHVNKSCKIGCCDNKTHQIIQNMILSQGLETKSVVKDDCLRSASFTLEMGKGLRICAPIEINMGEEVHLLFPICKIRMLT